MEIKLSAGSWAYVYGPYAAHPVPFPQVVKTCADLGFDGVSICGYAPHVTPDAYAQMQQIESLRQLFVEHGIVPVEYSPDTMDLNPLDSPEEYIGLMRKNITFMRKAGFGILRLDTVIPPQNFTAQIGRAAMERVAETFQNVAQFGMEHGIRTVWEFEPGLFLNKPSEIVELIERVNLDCFTALFDSCHAYMCSVIGARQYGTREVLPGGAAELARLLGGKMYPVTLGHEFAGTVCATGNDDDKDLIGKHVAVFNIVPCHQCSRCLVGDYAHCESISYLGTRIDGGFAEYCLVPSKFNLVVCNENEIPFEMLCMAEPSAVALHATRAADIKPWETELILGAGPIGILAARWAHYFGVEHVVAADIVQEKMNFARTHGVETIDVRDAASYISDITGGKGADVVIEGTGSGAGWVSALNAVSAGGRIVLLGNPQRDVVVPTENYSTLLRKELTLKSVWNSYYGEAPVNEWKFVIDKMERKLFNPMDLITQKSKLEEVPSLFEDIYQHKIVSCKAVYSAQQK